MQQAEAMETPFDTACAHVQLGSHVEECPQREGTER